MFLYHPVRRARRRAIRRTRRRATSGLGYWLIAGLVLYALEHGLSHL